MNICNIIVTQTQIFSKHFRSEGDLEIFKNLIMYLHFLGANAPLGPASSEGLYVCMSVCNTLAPLSFSPLPSKRDKETEKQKETDKDREIDRQRDKETNKQRDRDTEKVAQQLNIFLYQASIISSR